MSLKQELRRALRKVGYDLSRFTPASHPLARKKQILQTFGIDTVLDVGANTGQFAQLLRRDLGYTGRIISFEPQSRVFEVLKSNAKGDQAWEVYNCALGDAEGKGEINISRNPLGSSLLRVLPTFLNSAPAAEVVGKEEVTIRSLDSVFSDYCGNSKNIFLKIDTQGFENRVLQGATASLHCIRTIQMEMSLVTLYEGEVLFHDMCVFMAHKGYELISLEDVFSDSKTGRLMQVDGVFQRF